MSTRKHKTALPYENASSGERALVDTQKVLARFDVQSFGSMCDYERKVRQPQKLRPSSSQPDGRWIDKPEALT